MNLRLLILVALCIVAIETKSFLLLDDVTIVVGKHFLYQVGDKEFLSTHRVYRVVERGQKGLPDWLKYVNHTSQLIGSPQASNVGLYTIRVRAECIDPSVNHCQDRIGRTFHISVVEPLTAAESRGRPVIPVHVGTVAKHGKPSVKTDSESEMQHKYTNLIQPTRTFLHENTGVSPSTSSLHGNGVTHNLFNLDSSVQHDLLRPSPCDSNEVSFFASLILHVVYGLSDFQILNLKERLSLFSSKDISLISVTEGAAVLGSLQNSGHKHILTAGPGNVIESLNNSIELSWHVICNDFDKLTDFTRVLQHNVEVGRVTEELGYDVIAWFAYSDKPVPRRQKRSAHRQGRQTGTPSFVPPLPTTVTEPLSSIHASFSASSISISAISPEVHISTPALFSISSEFISSSSYSSLHFSSSLVSMASIFVEPTLSSYLSLSSHSVNSYLSVKDFYASSESSVKLSSVSLGSSFTLFSLSPSDLPLTPSLTSVNSSVTESILIYPTSTFIISTRSEIPSSASDFTSMSSILPEMPSTYVSFQTTPISDIQSRFQSTVNSLSVASVISSVVSRSTRFDMSSTPLHNVTTTFTSMRLVSISAVSDSYKSSLLQIESTLFTSMEGSTSFLLTTNLMTDVKPSELSTPYITFSSISSLPFNINASLSKYQIVSPSTSAASLTSLFSSINFASSSISTFLSSLDRSQIIYDISVLSSSSVFSPEMSDLLPTSSFAALASYFTSSTMQDGTVNSASGTFSISSSIHVFSSVMPTLSPTSDANTESTLTEILLSPSLSPTFSTVSYSTHFVSIVTPDVSSLPFVSSSKLFSSDMLSGFQSEATLFSFYTSSAFSSSVRNISETSVSSSFFNIYSSSLLQYLNVSSTFITLSSVLPFVSSSLFIRTSYSFSSASRFLIATLFPSDSTPVSSLTSSVFPVSSVMLPSFSSAVSLESTSVKSSATFSLVPPASFMPTSVILSSSLVPSTNVLSSSLVSSFVPSTSVLSSSFVLPTSVLASTSVLPFSITPLISVLPSVLLPSTSVLPSILLPSTSGLTSIPLPPSASVLPSILLPSTSVLPSILLPSTSVLPSMLLPSTSVLPSTLLPSTSVLPSMLLPSTSVLPSILLPSISVLPSILLPSTSVLPSTLLPSTSVLPSTLLPSTSILPSILLPSTSVFPSILLPSTSVLPSILLPSTSVLPSILLPSTSVLPSILITSITVLSSFLVPSTIITSMSFPSVVTPSSTQPVTSSIVPTTAAPDALPVLQVAIDHLEVYVGRYFELKIPEKTFNDTEDGSTSSLNLSISLVYGKSFPVDSWLMFDPGTQTLYGLPLMRDLESGENKQVLEKFILTASDSKGQIAKDVISIAYKYDKDVTHAIALKFDGDFEVFEADRNALIGVAQRIAKFYGDSDMKFLTFFEMENGSITINWGNNSLFGKECLREEIEDIFDHLIDGNTSLSNNFTRLFSGIVPMSASLEYKGVCLLPLTTLPPSKPPLQSGEDEKFWLTIGVPALVVILLIIIIALLLLICCRHRRPSKEMSHSDKPAFLEDRRPIIFPEELEMVDPSLKPKNPLILPSDYLVETPPAVPPHGLADPPIYKPPVFDDSVFEAAPSNAPPPPGVAETATDPPPYRLPPPYYNPHRAVQNT